MSATTNEIRRNSRGRFLKGHSGNPSGPRRVASAGPRLTQLQLDGLLARAIDRASGSDEVLCALLVFFGLAALGAGTDSRPEGQAQ
jgi:hypothetical protein